MTKKQLILQSLLLPLLTCGMVACVNTDNDVVAQTKIANNAEEKNQYSLDDGRITFTAPDGLKPLSQELINSKFRDGQSKKVVGNESGKVTIAYQLKKGEKQLSQNDLESIKSAFTKYFSRIIPGIQWIKKDIIELSGKKWIYFELQSNAIDTEIHNIMLLTDHKGDMLIFNFNATKDEFPKYNKALEKSIQSIRIRN